MFVCKKVVYCSIIKNKQMETISTVKAELKTIKFKSHTLGEVFTAEVLFSKGETNRILNIITRNGFALSGFDLKEAGMDLLSKLSKQ